MNVVHCWQDSVEDASERFGFGSREWADAMLAPRGTYMLLDGHAGPHEFTPDSDIGVRFAEPEPEPEPMP